MKNKLQVPNIEEIGENVKKQYPDHYDDFLKNKNKVIICLNLLEGNPKFYDFLKKNNFYDYDLSTSVFEEIVYYIDNCLINNSNEDIKEILLYINDLLIKGSEDGVRLVSVGFLEFLASYNQNFDYIIDLMPDKLRELFKNNYMQNKNS